MAYKWKPSKSQKREFAERMQNPEEKKAYEDRRQERINKRKSTSKFDYNTAGGFFVPTKIQFDLAFKALMTSLTSEQKDACQQIISGYSLNEKIHHDYIHILNELNREGKIKI